MNLHSEVIGHGPDVVFLHGWAMNGAIWRTTAQQLADDYCCHLVDLPGHGGSPPLQSLTLEGCVALLDQAFPWPVHVVGWSLGGAVATQWALSRPEKVRSLTLTASSPCFVQRPDWQPAMPLDTMRQFADNLHRDWRGTLKRFISLQAMGDADARTVARGLTDELFAHGEPQMDALRAGLELLRTTDLRARIAELEQPLLLQYGDRDMLTPLGAGNWLAAQRRDAHLVVHRGAAHAPFISHLPAFVDHQRRFLGEI
ncbi:pimeloyl-[acyl-carrier protein] methyl ester esterase [Chitiniphilus shinanonensis]|uniref:Pimeloyl-[acyl-carrier protein] methyl ester esterase n=1 Tax=Chitiniphilus shinanonensis TaxID=553088 RepID=A0ABQ6BU39_9NEIS|nr:pimeloyl-ACP methyl ester esterase BioH [Chitiniphilus shinanonensis]GLS05513.1 pimeloyl-[acyl-carrier protein] methyl ester esterase [Chitiniphilus shinanonensis]